MELLGYIEQTRPEFKAICLKYIAEYERGLPSHPGAQRGRHGLAIHTVQVIEKALEWNQEFPPATIIETCLVHDLKDWCEFTLSAEQILAIQATKGLPWKTWRHSPHYRFVALILIADMWSAYVNVAGK